MAVAGLLFLTMFVVIGIPVYIFVEYFQPSQWRLRKFAKQVRVDFHHRSTETIWLIEEMHWDYPKLYASNLFKTSWNLRVKDYYHIRPTTSQEDALEEACGFLEEQTGYKWSVLEDEYNEHDYDTRIYLVREDYEKPYVDELFDV